MQIFIKTVFNKNTRLNLALFLLLWFDMIMTESSKVQRPRFNIVDKQNYRFCMFDSITSANKPYTAKNEYRTWQRILLSKSNHDGFPSRQNTILGTQKILRLLIHEKQMHLQTIRDCYAIWSGEIIATFKSKT